MAFHHGSSDLRLPNWVAVQWACIVGSIECLEALIGQDTKRASLLYLETSIHKTVLHLAVAEDNIDVRLCARGNAHLDRVRRGCSSYGSV